MTLSTYTLKVLFLWALLTLPSITLGDEPVEDTIECPLCSNSTHTPQDPLSRFVAGDQTLSCQSAFDLGPLELPPENCTFWQSRGDLICQCAAEAPEANDCTLCESGVLPEPLKEVLPGQVCSVVQVDAKRGSADLCVVYQQTVGVYCGCDNPEATAADQGVCRLCGGEQKLPVPLSLVAVIDEEGEEIATSCVELEFLANIPGSNCQEYQELYGNENCCLMESPTKAPVDGAATRSWTCCILGIATAGAFGFLAFN
jgi:hypothetical protein